MKCYLYGNVVPTDRERFIEYLEKVPAVFAQYGGRYIVRGGAVHPLEGDTDVRRVILVEFESREAAQRFYDSPEYAPLKQLRIETAESQVMLIDALGEDYVLGADGSIASATHRLLLPDPSK